MVLKKSYEAEMLGLTCENKFYFHLNMNIQLLSNYFSVILVILKTFWEPILFLITKILAALDTKLLIYVNYLTILEILLVILNLK
jgi:hypothetical protein